MAGKTYLAPLALYSKKIKSASEIKDCATIAIPNDPSNGGRALQLLAKQGWIELKPDVPATKVTKADITKYVKKIKIVEIEAPQLPRALPDVAAAAVNGTYARPAGLSIAKQGVLVESAKGSAYANVLVVRTADKNKPWVKTFIKAYHPPNMKAFIEKRFGDSTFTAW